MTAQVPLAGVSAYSAAKAAVVNLTRSLAREYAPRGVRFNVLCPGCFPGPEAGETLDQQRREQILQQTPMARCAL